MACCTPNYKKPIFNLFCDMWAGGVMPGVDDPTFAGVPCQLYFNSRDGGEGVMDSDEPSMQRTQVRIPDSILGWECNIIRVVTPNEHYFLVRSFHEVHAGFDNVYYTFLCVECDITGVPLMPVTTL